VTVQMIFFLTFIHLKNPEKLCITSFHKDMKTVFAIVNIHACFLSIKSSY